MSLSKEHLYLQQVVATILLHPKLTGTLCTFERVCPLVNMLSGYGDDVDGIAMVDAALIGRAFKDVSASKLKEYVSPYKSGRDNVNNAVDISVSNSFKDMGVKHYLFIRNSLKQRKVTYNEIGHYLTKGVIGAGCTTPDCGADDVPDHPLSIEPSLYKTNDMEIYRWVYNKVSDGLRNNLVVYLKEEKRRQIASAEKNRVAKEKKETEEREREARAKVLAELRTKRKQLSTPLGNISNSENDTPNSARGDKKRTKVEDEMNRLKELFTNTRSSVVAGIKSIIVIRITLTMDSVSLWNS